MNIVIVTSAAKSAGAASNWKGQYCRDGEWKMWGKNMPSEDTYKAILAAEGDPEKIAKAIGNTSWSHVSCVVCEMPKHVAVEFGNYDSTVTVCSTCLKAGVAALDAVTQVLVEEGGSQS